MFKLDTKNTKKFWIREENCWVDVPDFKIYQRGEGDSSKTEEKNEKEVNERKVFCGIAAIGGIIAGIGSFMDGYILTPSGASLLNYIGVYYFGIIYWAGIELVSFAGLSYLLYKFSSSINNKLSKYLSYIEINFDSKPPFCINIKDEKLNKKGEEDKKSLSKKEIAKGFAENGIIGIAYGIMMHDYSFIISGGILTFCMGCWYLINKIKDKLKEIRSE